MTRNLLINLFLIQIVISIPVKVTKELQENIKAMWARIDVELEKTLAMIKEQKAKKKAVKKAVKKK